MSLRVAFDLDGTIADMHAALRAQAEILFGTPVAPQTSPQASDGNPQDDDVDIRKAVSDLQLTPKQQTKLWDHVKTVTNFWNSLPEIEPGIVAHIAQTATARRWEVIFLTTRPMAAGDTTQIQSQRWLAAHGFALPSVFVVQRSRGKIADALHLDAVVDDRPENCLDVAIDSQAKPILVWYGDPAAVPPGAKRLGVRVVPSILEAVTVLEQLDDVRKGSPMVRSLKKFFGRATPV